MRRRSSASTTPGSHAFLDRRFGDFDHYALCAGTPQIVSRARASGKPIGEEPIAARRRIESTPRDVGTRGHTHDYVNHPRRVPIDGTLISRSCRICRNHRTMTPLGGTLFYLTHMEVREFRREQTGSGRRAISP